ncbi:MAG TPA: hypothetical protein VK631_11465 [Solirubrobacteraceae bacterium]|nr:hypothetical protein [Solirubrobacteraceae bacterium]
MSAFVLARAASAITCVNEVGRPAAIAAASVIARESTTLTAASRATRASTGLRPRFATIGVVPAGHTAAAGFRFLAALASCTAASPPATSANPKAAATRCRTRRSRSIRVAVARPDDAAVIAA